MATLRKQNIKIAIKKSAAEELDLTLGVIGTDGKNFFIGNSKTKKHLSNLTPIGSIIAWHPIGFSSPGNIGIIDLSGSINMPRGFVEASGNLLEDTDSPFNGYYLPDLTGNVFLMGSNTGGAGPAILNCNNSNNTITIASNFLPPHIHEIGSLNVPGVSTSGIGDHNHQALYPVMNPKNLIGGGWTFIKADDPYDVFPSTDAAGSHSHLISISPGEFQGTTGNGGFANDAISILPKYLSVKYIIKIK